MTTGTREDESRGWWGGEGNTGVSLNMNQEAGTDHKVGMSLHWRSETSKVISGKKKMRGSREMMRLREMGGHS